MRFWSEGLGDRQLVMDLSKAHIKRQDEVMVLSGVVTSPAPWEYEVKIKREDWARILQTAVTKEACGFIAERASLSQLVYMAGSVVTFLALLAWFRALHLLGLHGQEEVSASSAQPVPVQATAAKKNDSTSYR